MANLMHSVSKPQDFIVNKAIQQIMAGLRDSGTNQGLTTRIKALFLAAEHYYKDYN